MSQVAEVKTYGEIINTVRHGFLSEMWLVVVSLEDGKLGVAQNPLPPGHLVVCGAWQKFAARAFCRLLESWQWAKGDCSREALVKERARRFFFALKRCALAEVWAEILGCGESDWRTARLEAVERLDPAKQAAEFLRQYGRAV